MIRRNLKIFSFLLAGLFLIGVTGLIISINRWNHTYVQKQRTIAVLSNQLLKLNYKIDENKQKIALYDYMEFKTKAISRRYPIFSSILDVIYQKSREYGFRPDVVLGVVKVESDFNPNAVSYRGAYGLMQVNLGVWRDHLKIDTSRIFDIPYNIQIGLSILKGYYDVTGGNLKRALYLYNNGYRYANGNYLGKVDSAILSYCPSAPVENVIAD